MSRLENEQNVEAVTSVYRCNLTILRQPANQYFDMQMCAKNKFSLERYAKTVILSM